MKKLIVYLVMMIVSFCAYAQQIQSFQLPVQASSLNPGDSIIMRINNPWGFPTTFFPLMQGLGGAPQDLFRSSQHLVDWITEATAGVSPQNHILALVERIGSIMKTDAWVNSSLYPHLWNDWDNNPNDQILLQQSFAKNYSLPGSLVGSYSLNCGNHNQIGALLLQRTGLIEPERFRLVTSGRHVFLEIFYGDSVMGDWMITDLDVGTPNFMTYNRMNHQDFREMGWGLQALNEFKLHRFPSIFEGGSLVTVPVFSNPFSHSDQWHNEWYAYYQGITDTASVPNPIYSPYFFETYDFSSEIILPGRAILETGYVNKCLFIDTIQYPDLYHNSRELVLQAMEAMTAGDTILMLAFVDQLASMFADHFQIDQNVIRDTYIFDGRMVLNQGFWKLLFQREEIPFYTIIVSPGYYQIGLDIKAPGKVLSVKASPQSQVYLTDPYGNDTLILGGNPYEVPFWGTGDSSLFIPFKINHYLQEGWIHALDTIRIDVSWNPAIFNFLHGTLELETDYPLEVEYFVNGIDILDETVVSVDQEENILKVYPNPTGEVVYFPFGDVTLFDMMGQVVSSCTSCDHLLVNGYPKGLYLLMHTNGNTRIVVR